jgi:hypothetical protein
MDTRVLLLAGHHKGRVANAVKHLAKQGLWLCRACTKKTMSTTNRAQHKTTEEHTAETGGARKGHEVITAADEVGSSDSGWALRICTSTAPEGTKPVSTCTVQDCTGLVARDDVIQARKCPSTESG